jgi:hypothetical protein
MKKKIFMVLSAVTVLAMSVLVVACSKDSNALNPNEEIVVEEIVPTPPLQKSISAAEWEAFHVEVEKLNAKYLAPEVLSKAMRVGRDSGDMSRDEKVEIFEADAEGAARGSEWGAKWGTKGRIAVGVAVGAVASILKWWELTGNGLEASTKPLPSFDALSSDSVAVLIGERHNMIIEDFMNSPINITGMSDSAVLVDITSRYEELFTPIAADTRSFIISVRFDKFNNFSPEIRRVIDDYGTATMGMDNKQMHDYTEEYLDIVDAHLPDSEEKNQVVTYASVAYYSSSMWEIEE